MKIIILLSLMIGFIVVGCKNQTRRASLEIPISLKKDTMVLNYINNSIDAKFIGKIENDEGKYVVYVTFYPNTEKALLIEGGNRYELVQYITGSGYGYRNDILDLRGKGEEATITFVDGKRPVMYLKEQK